MNAANYLKIKDDLKVFSGYPKKHDGWLMSSSINCLDF